MESRGTHYHKVAANMSDTIIKNKKEKTCILIDVSALVDRNIMPTKAEKKLKYEYSNRVNVEREMYDYTSNNWSHHNSNTRFKEKF
jgi:hypothetical protein